jgi:hypothetical protein
VAKDLTLQKLEGIDRNIIIVGCPKCGQNSLQKFLADKYPNLQVNRAEMFWTPDKGRKMMEKNFPDYQVVIILRENVSRIWSSYHYFGMTHLSLEDYMKFDHKEFSTVGEGNPVIQSRYEEWLKHWEVYNPIVVWLEDMQGVEGFPHENPTKTSRREYPEMTSDDRRIIMEALLNG